MKVKFILFSFFVSLSIVGQEITFNVYTPFYLDTLFDFNEIKIKDVYSHGLIRKKQERFSFSFKDGLIDKEIHFSKERYLKKYNEVRFPVDSLKKFDVKASIKVPTVFIHNNRIDSIYTEYYNIYYQYHFSTVNYSIKQNKKKYYEAIFGSYVDFWFFPEYPLNFKEKYNRYLDIYYDEVNKADCYLLNKSLFTNAAPKIIIKKFDRIKIVKIYNRASITTKYHYKYDDRKDNHKLKSKIIIKMN